MAIASAGPTYTVARMADELTESGENASVLSLGRAPRDWPYKAPLEVHQGRVERWTAVSPALMREIVRRASAPCILHGHGLWRTASLFPLVLRSPSPARLVFSPRGMLAPACLRTKWALKQPFWHLAQRRALDRCHCLHATSAAELEDIRAIGLRNAVSLISNGVDVPNLDAVAPHKKQIVFLSRIDPIKGLDILLPAWTAIARKFPEWDLVIAGPLHGRYADSIQEFSRRIQAPRVTFVGEKLGGEKQALLSSASLFVLPSRSENFGLAVAEAMAHGTAVITTTATPWKDVDPRGCGWCVSPDERSLRAALEEALSRPVAELHQMGARGREWMSRDFAWSRIAAMMLQTYEWLLFGAQKPEHVFE